MMLHNRATGSKNYENHDNLQQSTDSLDHFEAAYRNPGSQMSRSKSINTFKLPIKAFPGNINNVNRMSNLPNTDRIYLNAQELARNVGPIHVAKKNSDSFTQRDGSNNKLEPINLDKKEAGQTPGKTQFFRATDVLKTQSKGLDPIGALPPKLSLRHIKSHELNSQNYLPIKSLSNYTLKPVAFNGGLTSKTKIQDVISFRSRKGQFISQSIGENHSFLKNYGHGNQGIGYTEHDLLKNKSVTEREDDPSHRNEEGSPLKPPYKDLKLPKLDSVPKHKSDGNLATSINEFNVGQVNSQNNQIHKRNYTEAQILDKPAREKVRSYDQHESSKLKLQQGELGGVHVIVNPPKILVRKRLTEPHHSSVNKTKESLSRENTPIQFRHSTRPVSKSNQTPSPLKELTDIVTVNSFAFKTQAGALPTKGTKTNQDSYVAQANFAGYKDKYFFAVCDGHGLNGHHVSNFVRQKLLKNAETQYKGVRDESFQHMKQYLTKVFLKTNRELSNSSIDVNFSGTTTVSVLIMNSKLWSANAGDSRAILAKCIKNQWSAIALSRDHKPDEPDEMERIIASGGRVDTFRDADGGPLGPNRVWLKDEDLPGLAMARSLGDGVAALAGVIPEPEIKEFHLVPEDKFIVVASDGVWEFLSNQQVVDIVVPFYEKNDLEGACDKLVKEATACWKQDGEIVDDITCIIISLKVESGK